MVGGKYCFFISRNISEFNFGYIVHLITLYGDGRTEGLAPYEELASLEVVAGHDEFLHRTCGHRHAEGAASAPRRKCDAGHPVGLHGEVHLAAVFHLWIVVDIAYFAAGQRRPFISFVVIFFFTCCKNKKIYEFWRDGDTFISTREGDFCREFGFIS